MSIKSKLAKQKVEDKKKEVKASKQRKKRALYEKEEMDNTQTQLEGMLEGFNYTHGECSGNQRHFAIKYKRRTIYVVYGWESYDMDYGEGCVVDCRSICIGIGFISNRLDTSCSVGTFENSFIRFLERNRLG